MRIFHKIKKKVETKYFLKIKKHQNNNISDKSVNLIKNYVNKDWKNKNNYLIKQSKNENIIFKDLENEIIFMKDIKFIQKIILKKKIIL